jgi:glycosyltransferase involved in cell wall biosynthesis
MTFSITIPAYKARFLDEAIKSVIAQTYQDWQLVIVDDCSPEDLKGIVEPYLADSRVEYYRNEKNCGAVDVVDNWNICLSHCTGDYVICMGDDDRLLPCCLKEYKMLIEKYPELNVYHCRTEIIDESGNVTGTQEERPERESALSMLWNRWDHRNKQFIGDFCYNATYLKSVEGYHKMPLAWGSDDITALKAAKERGIANTLTPCFQYRENSQTITSSAANAKIKIEAFIAQHRWYSTFLDEMAAKELSAEDRQYLDTIAAPRNKAIIKALGRYCPDYAKGNPLRMWWCYQQLRHLNVSATMFIKWYIRSVIS